MKFQRKSAAKTLLEYLKLDGAARSTYHKKNKSDLRPTALPHVLLHHLHLSSLPEVGATCPSLDYILIFC